MNLVIMSQPEIFLGGVEEEEPGLFFPMWQTAESGGDRWWRGRSGRSCSRVRKGKREKERAVGGSRVFVLSRHHSSTLTSITLTLVAWLFFLSVCFNPG